MPTEGPIQVAASADDAHEADDGTAFSVSGTRLQMRANPSASARKNGAARFTSVNVANGDTIDSVDFELHYVSYPQDDTRQNIFANAVDNAVDFASDADVTTRIDSAATSASVSWVHTAADNDRSTLDDGLDLNDVIQEVIDRGGWSANQAIVILMEAHDDIIVYGWTKAYDGDPSNAAELTITFTVGGGGPPTISSRRLLSGVGR